MPRPAASGGRKSVDLLLWVTYHIDMENPRTNLPLTDSQKLRLRNIQNRMLNLQSQLQSVLGEITRENAIDFNKLMLNDDLELIPLPQKPVAV